MRIGTMIGEVSPYGSGLDAMLAQVQRAERDGLHTAWFPHVFGVDALTVAALAGRVTSRIELGTAVVPTFSRHPIAMAQQALTAQAAASGRFALGIGLSHQIVVETMFGLSFAKPFTHMREYVAVLAPLIRSGACAFAGTEFRVNATVQVVGASPCPILLAALAPRMLALAGSEGDGTITWMTGPRTLRDHTIPRLQEAAARAGRPAPRIVAGLPIAVTDDVKGARERAASAFQVYGTLPSYRAMLEREQVAGPAEVAIVGDEAAVGEQLDGLSQLGVTDFLAGPFATGTDRQASLDRTYRFLASLAARVGG